MLPMRPCPACGFEHPEQVVVCPSTQQVIGAAVLGGRYRLDRLIAVGGIGAVYDARALHIDRRVAVKRLLPAYTSDPEVVRRFQREARAAGRIEHPNVVEVLDFGVGEDGIPFLVMEFLEGDTLAARIESAPGQRVPFDELLPVMLDVLQALAHAHSHNIVHRDLKPENIFLAHRANQTIQTKLVDLGISKAIGSTSQAITQSGSALGTPHYMAPEQLRGEKDVDGRVDLYALGIVMYRALSGAFPFDGRTFEHLVTRILDGTCAPLSTVVPGLPQDLSDAVAWAMHKEREYRAPSAQALALALAPFAPASLRPSTQPRLATTERGAQASVPPAAATERRPASSVSPEASTHESTTTKRPSAPERPEPFRIAGTEELQASATVPVVAAASNTTPPPRQSRRIWLAVVLGLLLLGGSAAAAYFLFLRDGDQRRAPEHPPTGGLAGSARPDLPVPGPASVDALVAYAPGPDAAVAVPPAAPDASTPPPPPPPPPPDAGPAAVAVETAEHADAATARPDAALPREAVDAARPDARAAREAAVEAATREVAVVRDSAPDVAPPEDEGAAAPEAAVEARAAQPTVEEVVRVFLRLADLAARCAEGEGPGEFRVSASVRGSDGRVRDVTVTTGFSDQARQCVQNLAAGLAFPPFGDETASFEHTFAVSGEVDAGTGDGGAPTVQDIRRLLRRAQRQALTCVPGVQGSIVLLVRVDGTAQTATLVSIEGDVTAEQSECLRQVVESTVVQAYPGTWTVPLSLQ